jgi:hypothetical protein
LNLFPHRNNLHSIDEFICPTEISVALPCVKTSWTKNPGPSRSLSSTDSFVRAKVVAFKSRTSSYYTLLAQYQQKYLIENVIRPRMNWSGDLLCSPSTTKSDMLKFILNDDINFMRLRYRIRVPAIETYLGTILFGNSIPDLQVQATLRNDRRTLSQQQLKDFIPSTALSDTTIDFCIHLHRINENKIQSVFNLTEKPKECLLLYPSFLEKLKNKNVVHDTEVSQYRSIIIPFRLENNTWGCIFIPINLDKKIHFFIPSCMCYPIPSQLKGSMVKYSSVLNKYFRLGGYKYELITNDGFYEIPEVDENDTGIYVIAFIDHSIHHVPLILENDDLSILRSHYLLSILDSNTNY